MNEITTIFQKTMWSLALKLVWLMILMFLFYAVVFLLARLIRFPREIANVLGGASSLVALYVWIQYFLSR
ncbi:hypothetical protein GsuE55_20700 [Geobacillus subterraneus]|uniref:Uncharacterized protein n=1 Tax=Geobacillus subterraneus TaxID=129338 RepID=A0A679FSI4_9BACL|nr:hypothetical protein GsuE55_20700 [Geobacillus subterraneus]